MTDRPTQGQPHEVGIDMLTQDPGLDVPPTSDDPLADVGDLMSADSDPLPDDLAPSDLPGTPQGNNAD